MVALLFAYLKQNRIDLIYIRIVHIGTAFYFGFLHIDDAADVENRIRLNFLKPLQARGEAIVE